MNGYFDVIGKYAQFGGRASRDEYWTFVAVNGVITIAVGVAGKFLHNGVGTAIHAAAIGYSMLVALPSLAVCVRRLHDTSRSGLYVLLGLIPFVGAVALLVMAFQDSAEGPNEYGPEPAALLD